MNTFFTYEEGSLLLRLLIAHCVTDFFLQPDLWIADKKKKIFRSKYLWYHGFVTGVIAWILLWDWKAAIPVLLLTVSHIIIDGLKLSVGKTRKKVADEFLLFVVDQLLHLAVIICLWLWLIDGWNKMNAVIKEILPDSKILLRILGYIIMIGPVGFIIQFLTRRWASEINTNDSLKNAGKWIGILERVLILTFVYINEFGAIGFLIAAKSILRVTDKPFVTEPESSSDKPFSPRKHTEYVLIGTFLSFAIAIIAGLLINRLLKL